MIVFCSSIIHTLCNTFTFAENDVPIDIKLCAYNGGIINDDGASSLDYESSDDEPENYDIKRLEITSSSQNVVAGWWSSACDNDSF